MKSVLEDVELLSKQAQILEVPLHDYIESSPRQRVAYKMRFIRRARSYARSVGKNEEAYIAELLRDFPVSKTTYPKFEQKEPTSSSGAAEEESEEEDEDSSDDDDEEEDDDESEDLGEQWQGAVVSKTQSPSETVNFKGQTLTRLSLSDEKKREIVEKVKQDMSSKKPRPVAEDPPFQMQGDVKVYTESGEEDHRPAEIDPMKRDGVTIGKITERERPPIDDLVGDRSPRTLSDLYARWPIADDPSFSIRIERTKPRRHAGVDVAGFVGEIRGRAISEADIQRWLGGTEYLLTVYGPDPRGRRDINDVPIIKPLTDPIKLTVPVLPPNVGAIPAVQGTEVDMNGMNPFGATAAPPITNQHDAAIHKVNVEYATNLLKMQREDSEKSQKAEASSNTSVFAILAKSQELQTQALREDALARERLMEKQLEAERQARKDVEAKLDNFQRMVEEKTGKGFDVESLSKLLTTVGPNREAESQRQAEYYRMQMETLRNSHEESMKQLRERHNDEMRRSDERLKDNESFYKRLLEDERGKSSERERDLRAEIEKIRREERDLAQQRLSEAKERFESELRQAEKGHEREMRSLREAWETKMSVADRTNQMSVNSLQERLQEAQQEAERAREEAKESADPIKVMEKAKAQAEAMGFEKKDDAPKTAFERFAATAGAGLSQALSTINEWGPQMLAARAAGAQGPMPPGMPQLPPGAPRMLPRGMQQNPAFQQHQQRPNPARGPQAPRKSRAATWATENVRPPQAPEMPETPLGFQQEPEPQPQSVEAPVEAVQSAPKEGAAEADFPKLPEKFTQEFSQEAIFGFLLQAEQSINNGIDPEVFSDQFKRTFPEEAARMAQKFESEEVLAAVRGINGAEASPILRRDGTKWIHDLWRYLRTQNAA